MRISALELSRTLFHELLTYSSILHGFCSSVSPDLLNTAFSTHLPVLIGISNLFSIKNIIELGSGPISTCKFLDRILFPELQQIFSFENDPFWYGLTYRVTCFDQRLSLRLVSGQIAEVVKNLSFQNVDLVFIDDSKSYSERIQTIKQVEAQFGMKGLVVIHDIEFLAYQAAASGFANRFIFNQFTPHTGIFWNDDESKVQLFHSLAQRMQLIKGEIDIPTFYRWKKELTFSR